MNLYRCLVIFSENQRNNTAVDLKESNKEPGVLLP